MALNALAFSDSFLGSISKNFPPWYEPQCQLIFFFHLRVIFPISEKSFKHNQISLQNRLECYSHNTGCQWSVHFDMAFDYDANLLGNWRDSPEISYKIHWLSETFWNPEPGFSKYGQEIGNISILWTLIAVVIVQLLSHVQLFGDPLDCSSSGSSVHGISQVRILECVGISFSRGSSQPRDWTHVSCISLQILYCGTTREAQTLIQFSSVAQSCPTLCNLINHSTPGLPVHHQLLESTQIHVHWAGDAIQTSHPLSSPSPPALNLYQHQGLQMGIPRQCLAAAAAKSLQSCLTLCDPIHGNALDPSN